MKIVCLNPPTCMKKFLRFFKNLFSKEKKNAD